MKNNNAAIFLFLFGLGIVTSSFFSGGDSEPVLPVMPQDLKGVFIDSPAVQLPGFTFEDHNGELFNNQNLQGKWSLVFFGYTSCPDVCPTTMSVLEKLKRKDSTPKDTQYVFVSVDPARDTPKVLKEFVGYFDEDFIGVTGPRSELDKFKEPLGVIYDYEGDTSKDEYVVNHFAAIYVISPDGKQRAYVLPPHSIEQVAEAYQLIRSHY